jgi:hypothetical protein
MHIFQRLLIHIADGKMICHVAALSIGEAAAAAALLRRHYTRTPRARHLRPNDFNKSRRAARLARSASPRALCLKQKPSRSDFERLASSSGSILF